MIAVPIHECVACGEEFQGHSALCVYCRDDDTFVKEALFASENHMSAEDY